VVAVDQLTEAWALAALGSEGASRPLLGRVDVTLLLNRSNAFQVTPVWGEISRWGLSAFNLAVAMALGVWVLRRPRRRAATLAAGFLAGGAIGNAVDRIRIGAVVDFLDLSRIGFHWIFNDADASVDAGIALMILAVIAPGDGRKPHAAADVR
jgi:signal peptidase II